MSKRGQIVDLGKHKPLGSSWRSVDTAGYSRVYEPLTCKAHLNFSESVFTLRQT